MKYIQRWCLGAIVAVVCVPLFFSTLFSYPYVFTQVHLFRILVDVAVIPFVFYILWTGDWRTLTSSWFWLIGAYFVSLLLSALVSIAPHMTIYGSWFRFGGLIDAVHWVAFIIMCLVLINSKEKWRYLMRVITLAGTIEAVFVFAQTSGLFHLYFFGDRAFGTLGNPALLASYILLTSGIALYGAMNDSRQIRWLYLISFAFQIMALYLTRTRSALLAIGIVVLVASVAGLFTWMRRSRTMLIRRLSLFFLAAFVLIALTLVFIGVRMIPLNGTGRAAAVGTRVLSWQIAVNGFIERPLLGWGENTYAAVATTHYDPQLFLGSGDTQVFDKPHNQYLESAVNGGIVGFITFCLFILFPFFVYFRQPPERRRRLLILLAAYSAYVIHLGFLFYSIGDVIMMSIYIGFFYHQLPRQQSPVHPMRSWQVFVAVLLSIGIVFVVNTKEIVASLMIRSVAHRPITTDSINTYRMAWPLAAPGRQLIVQQVASQLPFADSSDADRQFAFGLLKRMSIESLLEYPYSVDLYVILYRTYRDYGLNRPDDVRTAIHVLDAASGMSPPTPRLDELRGLTYLDLADTQSGSERERSVQAAVENFGNARFAAPHIRELAVVYKGAASILHDTHKEFVDYLNANRSTFSLTEWRIAAAMLYYMHDPVLVRPFIATIATDQSIDQSEREGIWDLLGGSLHS